MHKLAYCLLQIACYVDFHYYVGAVSIRFRPPPGSAPWHESDFEELPELIKDQSSRGEFGDNSEIDEINEGIQEAEAEALH